jgi:hypothetical protein
MSKKQRTRNHKDYNERRNALLEEIGSPFGFMQNEAVALFNASVVRKSDVSKTPSIEKLGYVAGVISLNEEIEVLVKFHDETLQLKKPEFKDLIVVLPG